MVFPSDKNIVIYIIILNALDTIFTMKIFIFGSKVIKKSLSKRPLELALSCLVSHNYITNYT